MCSWRAIPGRKERDVVMGENTRLLNGYCHLVNKTIFFINKYLEGIIPAGRLDQDIYWKTKAVYEEVEALIEEGCEEEAEQLIEAYLDDANQYFEEGRPWETCRADRRAFRNTVLNSVQMIANLTILLETSFDYPTQKVGGWLSLEGGWQVQRVHSGHELPRTETITLIDVLSECI